MSASHPSPTGRPKKGDMVVYFVYGDGSSDRWHAPADKIQEKHRVAIRAACDAWIEGIHPGSLAARSPAPSDEQPSKVHLVYGLDGIPRYEPTQTIPMPVVDACREFRVPASVGAATVPASMLVRNTSDRGEIPAAPILEARDADRESIAQALWIGFGLHVEKLGFHNDPESALRAASLIVQYARAATPEKT